MYIYIYICVCVCSMFYCIIQEFKDPKNFWSSQEKIVSWRKNVFFFVKKPYLGYCWMCTNLSKSGGLVLYQISASPHVATSY